MENRFKAQEVLIRIDICVEHIQELKQITGVSGFQGEKMAVIVKYIVVRNGEEKMTFERKK